MKLSKFCIGQTVIEYHTRNSHTITAIYPDGRLVLDNFLILSNKAVLKIEEFLDPTSHYYHHSRFGDGVALSNEGFLEYMSALEEISYIRQFAKDQAFIQRMETKAEQWLKDASEKIERGLQWKRTAEHNLAQWQGLTLDHHRPFLNPENVTSY